MTIVIHPYNQNWPVEFERIRASIQNALGELALRIDHIGSTSVPGLGAKDIIDIQITVAALSKRALSDMTNAGFVHKDWIERDHVPLGDDETPTLWEKWVFCEKEGDRRANIHMRIAGNPNQRYALLFRDYLRAHPNSVRSIELIKRELAKHHGDDVETYYDIKDPVYDLIWDAAQAWARFTNWAI